jgi:hypothetical protein
MMLVPSSIELGLRSWNPHLNPTADHGSDVSSLDSPLTSSEFPARKEHDPIDIPGMVVADKEQALLPNQS